MTIIDHIMKLYETSCEILTPKSYQWKVVAQKMYEIAKEFKKQEAMLKCHNCGKQVRGCVKLIRNGKIQETGFCCYDCYLKFWSNNPRFSPLPKA